MKKINSSVFIGAIFLMASSAVGPGFLTQTALFTAALGASFGFVILLSIILDAVAQLNIWRIIAVAELPAQDIANKVFPGLGYFLSLLVFLGGLAFNIGNISGAGLGLNVLFGIEVWQGAIISALIAIGVFVYREAGKTMDTFVKILGCVKILLIIYIAFKNSPPIAEAAYRSVFPEKFDFNAVLTIVGGTVGGYITFAGAHRLLDAKQTGIENLSAINKGALTAIGLASMIRIFLFVAALGVVSAGGILNSQNPAASVFEFSAGVIGYKLFGLILWAAGISTVVGSAYTSLSFIKSFHPVLQLKNRQLIVLFIIISTSIFLAIGKPVRILVAAGAINGMILPVALLVMLVAAYRSEIVKGYRQPAWLTVAGVMIVIIMTWMSVQAILHILG